MTPAYHEFNAYQGDDFYQEITLTDEDNEPIDLLAENARADMHIKPGLKEDTVLMISSVENDGPDGDIEFEEGKIKLYIDRDKLAGIDPHRGYIYDLQIEREIDGRTVRQTWMAGSFVIEAETTSL